MLRGYEVSVVLDVMLMPYISLGVNDKGGKNKT